MPSRSIRLCWLALLLPFMLVVDTPPPLPFACVPMTSTFDSPLLPLPDLLFWLLVAPTSVHTFWLPLTRLLLLGTYGVPFDLHLLVIAAPIAPL